MAQKELILVIGEVAAGRDEWVERKVWKENPASVAVVHLDNSTRSLHWGCKQLKTALEQPRVRTVIFSDASTNLPGARIAVIRAAKEVPKISLYITGVYIEHACATLQKVNPGMQALYTTWSESWKAAKRETAKGFIRHSSERQKSDEHVVRSRLLLDAVYSRESAVSVQGVVKPVITEGFDSLVVAEAAKFFCFELSHPTACGSTGDTAISGTTSEANIVATPANSVVFDNCVLMLDACFVMEDCSLRKGVANLLHFFFNERGVPEAKRIVLLTFTSLPDIQQFWGAPTITTSEAIERLSTAFKALKMPYPLYFYLASTDPAFQTTKEIAEWSVLKACKRQRGVVLNKMSVSDVAYLQYVFKADLAKFFVVSSTSLLGQGTTHYQKLSAATGLSYLDFDQLLAATTSSTAHHDAGLLQHLATKILLNTSKDPSVQRFNTLLSDLGPKTDSHTSLAQYYPLLFGGDRNVGVSHSHDGVLEGSVLMKGAAIANRFGSLFLVHGVTGVVEMEQMLLSRENLPHMEEKVVQLVRSLEETSEKLFGESQVAKGQKFYKKGMTSFGSAVPMKSEMKPDRHHNNANLGVTMQCQAADGKSTYNVVLHCLYNPKLRHISSFSHILCDCAKEVRNDFSFCRHATAATIHLFTEGIPVTDLPSFDQPPDVFDAFFGKKGDIKEEASELQLDPEVKETQPQEEVPQGGGLASKAFGILERIREFCSPPVEKDAMHLASLKVADKLPRTDTITDENNPDPEPPQPPKRKVKSPQHTRPGAAGALPAFMVAPPEPTRTAKAKRARADPNAPQPPKRPLSAYIFYIKRNRPEIALENPNAKITEIAKIMGARWRALSEAEKAPYCAEAADDVIRHKTELAAFQREHPDYSKPSAKPRQVAPPVAAPEQKKTDEETFNERFERQTSWNVDAEGRWVHDHDDLLDGDDDDDGFMFPPKKRPRHEAPPLLPRPSKRSYDEAIKAAKDEDEGSILSADQRGVKMEDKEEETKVPKEEVFLEESIDFACFEPLEEAAPVLQLRKNVVNETEQPNEPPKKKRCTIKPALTLPTQKAEPKTEPQIQQQYTKGVPAHTTKKKTTENDWAVKTEKQEDEEEEEMALVKEEPELMPLVRSVPKASRRSGGSRALSGLTAASSLGDEVGDLFFGKKR